jgi:hypothetical protein
MREPGGGGATWCPSCGLAATPGRRLPEPPFPSSAECWSTYGELTAYDVERARTDFRHQHAVDAYAAQHPGPPARPITLWFALVGLHLAVDRGRTGRQVQQAHVRLGRRHRDWPVLPAPFRRATLTVGDVLHRAPGDERDAAILDWAADVWAGWEAQHPVVAELTATIDA